MAYEYLSKFETVMALETYEKATQWSSLLGGMKSEWHLTPEGQMLSTGRMFVPGQIIAYERRYRNTDSNDIHDRYFFLQVAALRKGAATAKSEIPVGHGSAAYLRQTYPDIVVQLPDGRQISWLVYVGERSSGRSSGNANIIAQISPAARQYIAQGAQKNGYPLVYGWMGGRSMAELVQLMKQEKERQQAESMMKVQQKLAREQAQQDAAAARERDKALAKDAADLFRQL